MANNDTRVVKLIRQAIQKAEKAESVEAKLDVLITLTALGASSLIDNRDWRDQITKYILSKGVKTR